MELVLYLKFCYLFEIRKKIKKTKFQSKATFNFLK